jgi:hypothetical protein
MVDTAYDLCNKKGIIPIIMKKDDSTNLTSILSINEVEAQSTFFDNKLSYLSFNEIGTS